MSKPIHTISLDGSQYWTLNGKFHREDGSAIIISGGREEWRINGNYHRIDGPAVIYNDKDKDWYQNGLLHREDGPAREYSGDNKPLWFYKGQHIDCSSQEDFERIINLKGFW